MRDSKILRKAPVPKPIDRRLYVDVEVECSVCDDSGWVRIEELDLVKIERTPSFHYICAKHNTPKPS